MFDNESKDVNIQYNNQFGKSKINNNEENVSVDLKPDKYRYSASFYPKGVNFKLDINDNSHGGIIKKFNTAIIDKQKLDFDLGAEVNVSQKKENNLREDDDDEKDNVSKAGRSYISL